MPNAFDSTPLSRIDELRSAASRAAAAASADPPQPLSPDDGDELAELAAVLDGVRDSRLAQVRNKVRTYVFGALRRAVLETEAAMPGSIPPEDYKEIATQELNNLLADDGVNLSLALAGTLTE